MPTQKKYPSRKRKRPGVKRRGYKEAQRALLEFIYVYKTSPENDGNLPSFKEMGRALSVSTATAYMIALRLVGNGLLRFNHNHKLVLGGTYIAPENFPPEDF